MTNRELAAALGLRVICPGAEREIKNVYCGDLLSWVMGRAQQDNVWITIMSNMNIVAVASLSDVSAVILAEGVSLEQNVIDTAAAKGLGKALEDGLFLLSGDHAGSDEGHADMVVLGK